MTPAKVQPALLGGVTIGVLSALPFVMIGNCCCCAWVLLGGALSAYLMQQNHPEPDRGRRRRRGRTARRRASARSCGWSCRLLINTFMAPMQSGMVQQVLRDSANMPPAMRDILESTQIGPGDGAGPDFRLLCDADGHDAIRHARRPLRRADVQKEPAASRSPADSPIAAEIPCARGTRHEALHRSALPAEA